MLRGLGSLTRLLALGGLGDQGVRGKSARESRQAGGVGRPLQELSPPQCLVVHAVRLPAAMRTVRYLPVFLLCALSLAACGGDKIDATDTEQEIAAGVEKQTATEDVTIKCPDDVERKKNDVFECALTAAGGVKATVEVTQVDDAGAIRWEVNP